MEVKRTALIGLLILSLLFVPTIPFAQANQDTNFLFIDQLKPGMTGIGKTVVKGDRIQSFLVRIVDVIDRPGVTGDQILVRASGDAIDKSGGIAAGMSGSPVYVDNKLIGAISAAATFDVAKDPIAVVTPIENMLKLIDLVKKKITESSKPQVEFFKPQNSSAPTTKSDLVSIANIEATMPGSSKRFLNPNHYRLKAGRDWQKELATPVWVSGMTGRAFKQLKEGTKEGFLNRESKLLNYIPQSAPDFISLMKLGLESRYSIELYQLGSWGQPSRVLDSQGDASPKELEPGAALGVLLADGDVSIGALGTVTYIEGDIILAFGHPFLFNGSSQLFLTKAHILDTVESLEFPFKYGVPTEKIGAIFEDRAQGVAGALGVKPASIEISVGVKDLDKELAKEFSIQIARDPKFSPQLIYSTLLQTVNTTLNRIGKGSLKISYQIRGDGLPKNLNREDFFYSFEDVAPLGPLQVAQAAFVLIQNEFRDPEISAIDVEMEVEEKIRLARIKSLQVDKNEYKPGDTINYTVTLKPFRGEEKKVKGKLIIPQDTSRSNLSVTAFGGQRESENGEETTEVESLEKLLEAVETINANNQLTVEILNLAEKDEEKRTNQKLTSFRKVEEKVIVGEKTIQIEIKSEKEKKQEEKETEEGKDGEKGELSP